jgi:membrane protease YdiL (CAAX protease family)
MFRSVRLTTLLSGRGALSALGAYVLTAAEAGLFAGVIVVEKHWPLVGALPFACLAVLPLLPVQAWALRRLGAGEPPAPRTSTPWREALSGLGTTLGFALSAPIALLAAVAVGAGLLAASWAGELAGSTTDLATALQARSAEVHGVEDLPRWMIVATSGLVFASLGALAIGWTAVLGRLRGHGAVAGLRDGLALAGTGRATLLVSLVGGLAVGWLPGTIANVLAASPAYLATVRGVLGEPTSLGWLDATLTTGALTDRVGMAVVVALLGPVVEELVFRGFLWSALERWLPAPIVLAATTALFALAHLDPVHTPAVVLIGLFLGWLRLTSGSLAPSILAHALNNTVGVALAWRGAGMPDGIAIALGGLTVAVAFAMTEVRRVEAEQALA